VAAAEAAWATLQNDWQMMRPFSSDVNIFSAMTPTPYPVPDWAIVSIDPTTGALDISMDPAYHPVTAPALPVNPVGVPIAGYPTVFRSALSPDPNPTGFHYTDANNHVYVKVVSIVWGPAYVQIS
jgi:hypothetical protein